MTNPTSITSVSLILGSVVRMMIRRPRTLQSQTAPHPCSCGGIIASTPQGEHFFKHARPIKNKAPPPSPVRGLSSPAVAPREKSCRLNGLHKEQTLTKQHAATQHHAPGLWPILPQPCVSLSLIMLNNDKVKSRVCLMSPASPPR